MKTIKQISEHYNISTVLYGTGDNLCIPHIVVVYEYGETRVWIYPEGAGYNKPCDLIRLKGLA